MSGHHGQGDADHLRARFQEEAHFGRLPLLPEERTLGAPGVLATGFSYSVAAWCFLIGGYAANLVGARQGVVALLSGCVLGVLLSTLGSGLGCNRYGLEQLDHARSCFGRRGARVVLLFYALNQVGWAGLVLVMLGQGIGNLWRALSGGAADGVSRDGAEWVVRATVIVGLGLAYLGAVRGVRLLGRVGAWVTPLLIALTGYLVYVTLARVGWPALLARAPLAPGPDARLDYLIALEYGLGAGFSWWPGIGFLTRHARSQRASLYPPVLAMGLGMGLVCSTGLFAALAFREADPTAWLVPIGGPMAALLALALLAVANLSAASVLLYTAATACRQLGALARWPFRRLAATCLAPLALLVIAPAASYARGSAFLAYNATLFAPIAGVVAVDHLILRRGRLDASQVFEAAPGGRLAFLRGYNPIALGSVILGQGLYLALLDPVTFTARGPARLVGATLPAVLVPMVLHALLSRLAPSGWGGYGDDPGPRPLERPDI